MEDDQTMSEYYLAEHTPLPPELADVVEEAESSAPASGAHGVSCVRRRGRGQGHGSRGGQGRHGARGGD
ncbi:hypothetical protein E2562_017792 [Oryza meyeriana var. granulata]|uniref:Uncharacterized protein n=1 Tax=Oryza meyeriana var. granulata TaxID=110450 RepID=A0A6G1BN20_9ORYZ|nr:hypothetical protein E2562_017792 [Oryza meyeriana var. granulata]